MYIASRTAETQGLPQVYGALGKEVPGHRQEQLLKTLIVGLLITHCAGGGITPLHSPLFDPLGVEETVCKKKK